MPLFVTVTPGTTVTNSTTLDATTLNLLGTPSVDVVGTVDGGSLTLSDGSVTTGTIAANAVTFAKLQQIGADKLIGRDSAGTGDAAQIGVGGGLEFSGSDTVQIASRGVSEAKLFEVTTKKLLGRNATTNGDVQQITVGSGLALSDAGTLSASNSVTANQSSSNFAIPASQAKITWAHGFTSQVPHLFNAYLVCTDASGDAGYSLNDELDIKFAVITPPAIGGWIPAFYVTADATNIIIRAAYRTAPINVIQKSDGASAGVMSAINTSKWGIKLNAIRFATVSSIP